MIVLQVREAKTVLDKVVGLLLAKKPYPLLFKTRFGIHTFGMRFGIDVIVLDRKNRVVGLKERIKPKRVYFWNPRYNTIVELPKGTVAKENIKRGDGIILSYF